MTTLTTFKIKGYRKAFDIPTMIKEIENPTIFNNLRMVQQDEFNRLKKQYDIKKYLSPNYVSYLKNLYWNFILNKFTFDKNKTKQSSKPIHIGMKLYNKMLPN